MWFVMIILWLLDILSFVFKLHPIGVFKSSYIICVMISCISFISLFLKFDTIQKSNQKPKCYTLQSFVLSMNVHWFLNNFQDVIWFKVSLFIYYCLHLFESFYYHIVIICVFLHVFDFHICVFVYAIHFIVLI